MILLYISDFATNQVRIKCLSEDVDRAKGRQRLVPLFLLFIGRKCAEKNLDRFGRLVAGALLPGFL
jgi:hypothetical protein